MCEIPLPIKNISCQNLLGYQTVIHHGILRRRNAMNQFQENFIKGVKQLTHTNGSSSQQLVQWPRRYIILYDGCLYMYKDETSNKPARALSLYGYMKIEQCFGDMPSNVTWPFKMVHALAEKDQSLYFSAPTEKDMKMWVECLEQQLQYANGFNIALPSQSPTTCTAEQHLTNQIQDLGSGSLGRSKPAPNHRPTLKVSASVPQPQKGNTPNYMEMDGLTFSEDDDDEDEYDDYDKIDDLLKTKIKWGLEKSLTLPNGSEPPTSSRSRP